MGKSVLTRTTVLAMLALVGCGSSAASPPSAGLFSLPNPALTPGVADPRVTQADIQTTICVSGYTAAVRPSESVTEPEKLASMRAYGVTGPPSAYEYDHLISLELGGAPNDLRNLWPEPGASPNPKDGLEGHLHAEVCNGNISLATAQHEIATNWVATYRQWKRGTSATTTTTTSTTASPPPSSTRDAGVVHPGSFCSPSGATGHTSIGTPMVCGPASDGRDRWHHN
jgi:hypothetical protein